MSGIWLFRLFLTEQLAVRLQVYWWFLEFLKVEWETDLLVIKLLVLVCEAYIVSLSKSSQMAFLMTNSMFFLSSYKLENCFRAYMLSFVSLLDEVTKGATIVTNCFKIFCNI